MSFYQPPSVFYSPRITYPGPDIIPNFTQPPPPTPTHCFLTNGAIFYQDCYELSTLEAVGGGRMGPRDSEIYGPQRRKNSEMSIVSTSSNDFDEDLAYFVVPDLELSQRIVQQVEFLFSNANIANDKFLLKHIRKNKEGFVSLKLISSLKKVKKLSKDWRQVGYALEKYSKLLEMNNTMTKVKRIEPLLDIEDSAGPRTILALNLPLERPTIESVAEFFSVFGDVAFIRILKPGKPLPAEVHQLSVKHPELLSNVCALIEFENAEFASKTKDHFFSNFVDAIWVVDLNSPNELVNNGIVSLHHLDQLRRSDTQYGIPVPALPLLTPTRRKTSIYGSPECFPIVEEHFKMAGSMAQSAPTIACLPQRKNSKTSIALIPRRLSNCQNSNVQTSIISWMSRRASGQLDTPRAVVFRQPNIIRQPKGPEDSQGFDRWANTRMEHMSKVGNKVGKLELKAEVSCLGLEELKNIDKLL